MTSETNVESEQPEPFTPTSITDLERQVDRLGEQIAELIKNRDDHRDRADLLERSLIVLTANLADERVAKLEAKLELAKEQARTAHQIARASGHVGSVDVYAFVTGKPNGKDA